MIEKAWALGYALPEYGPTTHTYKLPGGDVTLRHGLVKNVWVPVLDLWAAQIDDVRKAADGL